MTTMGLTNFVMPKLREGFGQQTVGKMAENQGMVHDNRRHQE